MDVKFKLFLTIFILLILSVSSVLFYYSSYSCYRSEVSQLADISTSDYPENGEITIRTQDNKTIYHKHYIFNDRVSHSDFDVLLNKAVHFMSNKSGKNIIYNYFLKKLSKNSGSAPDNYLKRFFAAHFLEKTYGFKDLYMSFFNRIKFTDNIYGVGGLSLYLFGSKFGHLELKNQMYLLAYAFEFMNNNTVNHSAILSDVTAVSWKMYNEGFLAYDKYRHIAYSKITFNKYHQYASKKYRSIVSRVIKELNQYQIDYRKGRNVVKLGFNNKINSRLRLLMTRYLKKKDVRLDGAYLLIDYKNFHIKGMYGKKGGRYSDIFERVFRMKRQTGSVFKPFVYLTAFENGVKPYDYIDDSRTAYKYSSGIYYPKNYDNYYMGRTYIRNGLVYSLNNATVKLARNIGLNKVAETAGKFGLKPIKPFLSMPLGVNAFSVMEIGKAYAVFGGKGIKQDLTFIQSVKKNGELVLLKKEKERVVSGAGIETTLNCMRDVVRLGTARGKGLISGTAGKTGTTDNYKDAWFVQLLKPYVLVVWLGYDELYSMGENGTGGQMAAPVVANFQKYLYSEGGYKVVNKK